MAHKATVEPLSYTVPDALVALGIGRTTLYQLIKSGKLRKVKVGKRTLIPSSDLRAIAEAGIG